MEVNRLFSDTALKSITKFYGLFNLTPAQKKMYLMKGGIAAGIGFLGAGVGAGYRHFFGDKNKSGGTNNGGTNPNNTNNSNNTPTDDHSHDQSNEVDMHDSGGESHWYNPLSWFGGGD